MIATTYKELLERLQDDIAKGYVKSNDVVLCDIWVEEDYKNLAEDNVKVPWTQVAARVARKGDWVTEEMSQYLIEVADDLAGDN